MRLSFRPDDWTERQTGLFVILIGLLLYVPLAGSYGLYDPWETHYGEVAVTSAARIPARRLTNRETHR